MACIGQRAAVRLREFAIGLRVAGDSAIGIRGSGDYSANTHGASVTETSEGVILGPRSMPDR